MCHCKVLDYDYSWAFKLRTSLRKQSAGMRVGHALFLSIQAQDFIEELLSIRWWAANLVFLSIQAQDFIEDIILVEPVKPSVIPEHSSSGLHWGFVYFRRTEKGKRIFLSIQAQDFIEERKPVNIQDLYFSFLSIQAQDFIEECSRNVFTWTIANHSWAFKLRTSLRKAGESVDSGEPGEIPEHSSSGLHWGDSGRGEYMNVAAYSWAFKLRTSLRTE